MILCFVLQNEQQAPPQMLFVFPYGWIPQSKPKFFKLQLQRASLFESTFRELAAAPHSDFKKPPCGKYLIDFPLMINA